MRRWFLFLIAVLVGVGGVLFYAWYVNPAAPDETTPDLMRVDFRSDYVLMVAEVFQGAADLGMADEQLTFLGEEPAIEIIDQAIRFAEQNGYKQVDLALMWTLRDAYRASPQGLNP